MMAWLLVFFPLGVDLFFLKYTLKMQNIYPSSSRSDVILLDMGRDVPFRGLFLALLLPSLDLDLDALGASTDLN